MLAFGLHGLMNGSGEQGFGRNAYCRDAAEFRLEQVLQLRLAELGLVPLFSRIGVEHVDQGGHRHLQLGAHFLALQMTVWDAAAKGNTC